MFGKKEEGKEEIKKEPKKEIKEEKPKESKKETKEEKQEQKEVKSMGATMLSTPAGELYTALERGVVQGYGWPLQGILDLGWHEVTHYRVDPGFYTVELGVIVNLDRWNSLNEEQRAFLERMGRWLESLSDENPAINRTELQRQADAGIETIAFPPEVERRYLELAKEAGWARVMEMSPEHGPRMKQLFTK